MTVIVKHNKTNSITDWTQAQLDEQIALGNFAPGTTLANIVLPSDWNNDHTLTGVGTMAEQDATAVAITGGTINNTTIGATTATTGKFTSVTTPSVTATTTDLTLSAISTGAVNLATAGGTQFKSIDATSSVNVWNVRGGDGSTTSPRFTTEGTGTNIAGQFNTKGTGALQFLSGNTEQMRISNTASAVNYVQVTGSATTKAPIVSMQGTDTNISMAFQPKGTGAIDLAAGSSGVNISNGGIVTAITRTNAGSGYTTIPSVAISAPTTAGGVQATASVTAMTVNSVTIANGGTGYTVGNVLTVSGGTIAPSQLATQVTVSTVSSGVITAVTISQFGTYSVLPTNPASVTGGTGTGATFNFAYAISGASTNFTITNAGSGYIEQPTVTFSGGGGSGAAAYASVGSTPIIKSLFTTMSFNTAGGEQARVVDTATSDSFIQLKGGSATTAGAYVSVAGVARSLYVSSGSGGNVRFFTGGEGTTEQLRVSHTASAVNYVQVTGSTTTNFTAISAQGSDTNVSLSYISKGTGQHIFATNSSSGNGQFRVLHTAGTIANYGTVTGNVTGSAPIFSVAGTDTDIDLALTPKGTGLVRFGTYVAGTLLATGYINIKAADGTTYKVLVST
jgi:hypothetical protein